jgi:uncharacterized 2Fe-2S/4Fe-4S cluster protein (DUF4445 family)
MLDLEVLDESGYLEEDPFPLGGGVTLNAEDIRMLQLAKSAICAGLMTLIQNEKLQPSDIQTLYIAGGFGSYLNLENAGRVGLIPPELTPRTATVGNMALAGAVMLLLNRGARDETSMLSERAIVADLSSNPIFIDAYTEGMMFEG